MSILHFVFITPLSHDGHASAKTKVSHKLRARNRVDCTRYFQTYLHTKRRRFRHWYCRGGLDFTSGDSHWMVAPTFRTSEPSGRDLPVLPEEVGIEQCEGTLRNF